MITNKILLPESEIKIITKDFYGKILKNIENYSSTNDSLIKEQIFDQKLLPVLGVMVSKKVKEIPWIKNDLNVSEEDIVNNCVKYIAQYVSQFCIEEPITTYSFFNKIINYYFRRSLHRKEMIVM